MYSNNELVNAYFKDWLNDHNGVDNWAVDEVFNLTQQDPMKFWEVTRLLIAAAPTEAALAYVAAGPLEELLREHGLTLFDDIADEARKDKRFLYALSGVWLDEDDDIFHAALVQLVKEHNADSVNPLNGIPWSDENPMPGYHFNQ